MALELGLDQLQGQLEKFAKLPRGYRLAAIPVVAAIVLGSYGWFFYAPAAAERTRVQAQERELQRKVSEVRAIVANLAAFQKELDLKLALRQLPDSKELPGLLTDVSSLGKDAGLEFKSFRPGDEIPRDFYAEVPIQIEFSGEFHDIARFFDRVSKLPRIINVNELHMELADAKGQSTLLQVKGEATTFRFLEHDANQAAAPAGGAKPAAKGGKS
jgi:type IV pilus assembly protein PilO